jgi:hypothetical protein
MVSIYHGASCFWCAITYEGSFLMLFKSPPTCDKPSECRFEGGNSFTTTLAYTPTQYDRSGNLINPPWENKVVSSWRCVTCGQSWTEEI